MRSMPSGIIALERELLAAETVAPFTAWCADRGEQPDGSAARADYAGDQVTIDDPSLIPWPPARNEACWCGSSRKYKKCCAAPEEGSR